MLALVVAVGVAVFVEPEPGCGSTGPCGPDWHDMLAVGLFLGLLYWYVWLPEISLVAAPVLAALVVWQESPASDRAAARAAHLGIVAALALGWAAARSRIAVRRRQRRLAAQAAVVRHRPPEHAARLWRGTVRIMVGALLGVVAAGSGTAGLIGVREDERHAARAVRTPAEVTARTATAVRVRADDGRLLVLRVSHPGGYRLGSGLTVLEDGGWRRPAAEAYDPFGRHLMAMAIGLPGLVLLATGLIIRRRTVRLRRPVPALRVLLRFDHRGRAWVYAADDSRGHAPLFSCHCEPALLGPTEGADGRRNTGGAALDKHMSFTDSHLRQAVMFGEPYERGELVLVTTVGDGTPALLRTVEPVRPAGACDDPALEDPAAGSVGLGHPGRMRWTAASVGVAGEPVRWGPDRAARWLGCVIALCIALGVKVLTGRMAAGGLDENVIAVLGLLVLIHPAATLLNWQVTADSTGLWLTGAWTARHVPWEQLRSAARSRDGSVRIRLADGSSWRLPGMVRSAGDSRPGSPPPDVRMAEEISALCAQPELRPTAASPPRDHALSLGPLLLLLTGLAASVSFLG